MAFFRDSEGNLVGLVERRAGLLTPRTGAFGPARPASSLRRHMTFDDRFLTPQTAWALLSWRIVLAAMIGLVAALLGMAAGLAAGLGLAVYAATVLAAMPRDPSTPSTIDPFALSEPWRRFVQSAQRSRTPSTTRCARPTTGH